MTFYLSGNPFAHVYQAKIHNANRIKTAFEVKSSYAEINNNNGKATITMLSRELPFEIMETTQLENLVIQPFTAGDVFSLSIVNYPQLKSVILASCSFWNMNHCYSEEFKKNDYILEFKNCPALSVLKIDEYSCLNFNRFIMENCNSTKSVFFSNEALPFIRSISITRRDFPLYS